MNDESNQQQYYPPPEKGNMGTWIVVIVVILAVFATCMIFVVGSDKNYELTLILENRGTSDVYVNIYIDKDLKSEFRIDAGKTVTKVYTLSEGEHTIIIRSYGDLVETVYMDSDKSLSYVYG